MIAFCVVFIDVERENNDQLAEVRKLIQSFLNDEIQKIQSNSERQDVPSPREEKQWPARSGSAKAAKPQESK